MILLNAKKQLLILLLMAFVPQVLATTDSLIAKNSSWKYLDDGSNQGSAWKNLGFDDSSWAIGTAKLGFGDSNNATTINNHQSPNQTGAATWYFRKTFNVNDPILYSQLSYGIVRDDGAVVYLNGVEIGRDNMPTGTIDYQTLASTTVAGGFETAYFVHNAIANLLVAGENVVAVELHQRSLSSSDLGFNFELLASSAIIERGPYLQSQSPNSVVVKWRTTNAGNSRVIWGTDVNNLNQTASDATVSTEHEVKLTGLPANTTIYYAVGTTSGTFTPIGEHYKFKTPPANGTRQPVRFWVIGDSGTANTNAQAVKEAYLNYQPNIATDLWIMLGDNAYNQGADNEYQAAVFDMYPELLKTSALWSTIGNHDSANANSLTETGVYYDNFALPKQAATDGISTGADSGKEAYYSFDYANIHFVVLNSQETNATFRTGMINWLNNDLAISASDWTIALWHHPPYTKGTHDSDAEARLIYMRENILPILENRGIDLVLTGHSHAYERSWLLDSHYDSSNTFNAGLHVISNSLTQYFKPILGQNSHAGAVYIVDGSSGKVA
ncbi:MAG TPA: metallophosphoesterase family protein, partial [Oceanospirillales bacterium]|nr:metallophosphoesterase family protein [Oceanospirillales bacterium]